MGITSALPMLLDVLMLALFYYTTFGVVTTNLFASELGFRWGTCLSKAGLETSHYGYGVEPPYLHVCETGILSVRVRGFTC